MNKSEYTRVNLNRSKIIEQIKKKNSELICRDFNKLHYKTYLLFH